MWLSQSLMFGRNAVHHIECTSLRPSPPRMLRNSAPSGKFGSKDRRGDLIERSKVHGKIGPFCGGDGQEHLCGPYSKCALSEAIWEPSAEICGHLEAARGAITLLVNAGARGCFSPGRRA